MQVLLLRMKLKEEDIMKKVFGAFYEVSERHPLDFTNVFAVNFELVKCAKGILKIEFTDDESKQGFFVGGHAEANNKPEVSIRETQSVYTISVTQENPQGEGMLHLTLMLPQKKFSSITSVGSIMEYDVKGGEIDYINLANQKGEINVDVKANRVCLFSKWYPVNAKVEASGQSLFQLGSRMGNVTLSLKNVSELRVHVKPKDKEKYINQFKPDNGGYLADVYLQERAEGTYIIQ